MSEVDKTGTEPGAIEKYKTVGRAIAADDGSAAFELHAAFKESGRTLTEEEVQTLGIKWFQIKGKDPRVLDFLSDVGFDFSTCVPLKGQQVGYPLPFLLVGEESSEKILLDMVGRDLVDINVMDGCGFNLIDRAVAMRSFEFASELKNRGVDINHINVAGETALFTAAGELHFGGVKWFLENGVDVSVERHDQSRAPEVVPEGEHNGYNGDVMYETLMTAISKESWNPGSGFAIPDDFMEFVNMEIKEIEDEKAEAAAAATGKKRKPASGP